MADERVTIRREWNYRAVLIAVAVAFLLQTFVVLPCLCQDGKIRVQVAWLGDILVLIRLAVARVFRERGKGWIVYAILPFLFIPIILLAEHFWAPH